MTIKSIHDEIFKSKNKMISFKSLTLFFISISFLAAGFLSLYSSVSAGRGAIYIVSSYIPAILSFLFYYSFKKSMEQVSMLKAKQKYIKYLFRFSVDDLNAALEGNLLDPLSASMAMLIISDKYKLKNIELNKSQSLLGS